MQPTTNQPPRAAGEEETVIKLSVLVFTRGEFTYAECLDLSLITRRDSVAEALHALYEQIHLYLADAVTSGDWETAINRPATTDRWMMFYWCTVRDFLASLMRHELFPSAFRMPFDRSGNIAGVSA